MTSTPSKIEASTLVEGETLATFTAGPWKTVPNVKADDCPWSAYFDGLPREGVSTSRPVMANGETLALVVWEGWDDDEGAANARLISAAPDLLAALVALEGYLRTTPHHNVMEAAAARAVIAKAVAP